MSISLKSAHNCFIDEWAGGVNPANATVIESNAVIVKNLATDFSETDGSKYDLFPNPCFNFFNIILNDNILTEFRVYDSNSKCLIKKTLSGSSQISTETLQSGTYFYELIRNGIKIKNGKFVCLKN